MALKRAARGRRIAWGAAVLTIILGSAGVWAGRQAILESWWIHRLDSHDAKVRKEAAESLGRWGSARAAAALAEGFERGNPDALRILGEIERRADAQTRIVIVRRLLGLVEPLERRGLSGGEDIFSDLIQVLASAGTHTPEAFPLLIDALDRKGLTRCVAAIALARAWPASAGGLHAFLSTASLEQAGGLLGFLACHRPTAGEDTTAPELQALPAQAVREMLFALARDHQRPEIRALAVAAAAIEAAQNPSEEPDLEFLRGAFKSDRDPLVRRAALRSAGFLGHVPGNLGLPRLLLEEHDVATLREIIQARTLWASKLEPAELEVLEGIVLSAGKRPEKAEPLPLEPPEVARLEEVLSRERDPALRDAASVALSTLGNAAGSPPAPIAGLVVHEWGVWREAGSTLLSAVKLAAADLPGFVHRSRVSLSEFRAARTGSQLQGGKSVTLTGVNFKPVIFFRAPRPVSLRVRVYFHRGRPWTFFPDATDYLQGQISEEEPVQEEALGFAPRDDSDATCPPWIAKEAGKPVPASGDLKGRYPLVPWLLPAPSNVPGAGVIDGLGLEWRGLRVGYGEDLEGPLPPAPKDGEAGSWWTHLRNVPASPVALRGERDRFLFYEGANGLPSPLLVRWLDGSRKSLVLRTRDFRTIPKLTQWSGFTVEDLRRRGLEPPLCTEHLPGALVIHKEAGRAPRGRFVANFPSGSPPVRVELAALDLEGEPLRDRLREILAARGLTTEETLALLRSWELSTSTPRRRRSCGWASSGRSATGPSRSSPRRARPGQERSILSGPSNGRLRESPSGSGRSSPGRWTRSRSSRAGGSSELIRQRRARFSSRPKAGGSPMP